MSSVKYVVAEQILPKSSMNVTVSDLFPSDIDNVFLKAKFPVELSQKTRRKHVPLILGSNLLMLTAITVPLTYIIGVFKYSPSMGAVISIEIKPTLSE